VQQRIGERSDEGLEQLIGARVRDLPDPRDDLAVVDSIIDGVRQGRLVRLEVELDVDQKSLPVSALRVEDSVKGVQRNAVKLDRHATRPRSIAAATARASTCGATSWARKSTAPRSNAATAAPTEAAVLATRPS